ncbi:MAG TPA: hypothetical protein VIJ93_07305 [bacterium]
MKKTAPFTFLLILIFTSFHVFAQDHKTYTPSDTPSRDFKFTYFNLSPEKLWEKAYTELLKSQGQESKASQADLSFSAKTDLNLAESLFELASSPYGKNDVKGSVIPLKNEARFSYGKNLKNRHLAAEALYHGEADIKFFIRMDQTFKNPNLPKLTSGYDSKAYQLISDAELAFGQKDFNLMRSKLYQALWIVYPVTSMSAFAQP